MTKTFPRTLGGSGKSFELEAIFDGLTLPMGPPQLSRGAPDAALPAADGELCSET